jgi:hypothetical protein
MTKLGNTRQTWGITMTRRTHHTVPPIDFSHIGPGVEKVLDQLAEGKPKTRPFEGHDIEPLYDGTDPHPCAVACSTCGWEAKVER